MKYLVIGDAGFLGKAFCNYLIKQGSSVFGVDKNSLKDCTWNRTEVDIIDTESLFLVLKKVKPDVIVNLAVVFNEENVKQNFRINCFSILDLIQRCLADPALNKTKFVLFGSAAEYGLPKDRSKLKETSPLNPISAYGIVKACQAFFVNHFVNKDRARIVLIRPFNIIGPGLSANLFLGHCASQIVRIEQERQEPVLQVGNLESFRDMLSLSKAIEMIYLISEKGVVGQTYNLCSGQAIKMKDLLEKLLEHSKRKIKVEIDSKRLRKFDANYVVGDNQKYLELVGETRLDDTHDLDKAVMATLDWYRSNL